MSNTLFNFLDQTNLNAGLNLAHATSGANSGNNAVFGGLVAINAANPATSTAAAINDAPVTQTNLGFDLDSILDPDGIDIA